jgi:hypothetical protein
VGPQRWRAPTAISAPLKIAAVVALINRLGPDPPDHCLSTPGGGWAAVARLAFYGRRGSPPLAIATIYPAIACGGGVLMTIDGHTQPALAVSYQDGSDEVSVIARLNSILHIHLPGPS